MFVDDVPIEDEMDSYPPGCHAYVTDLGVLGVRFNTNLENDYEVDYFYAMICTEKYLIDTIIRHGIGPGPNRPAANIGVEVILNLVFLFGRALRWT